MDSFSAFKKQVLLATADSSYTPDVIRTAAIKTLGCRLNQAEMEALAAKLARRGIKIRPFGEAVDLTVINTCTVTNDADRDSRYAIRRAVKKSQGGRVVVTGCYAQMSPEAVRAMDGVDLVLGNDEKFRLLEHLGYSEDGTGNEREISVPSFPASKTRANLKIQDGCDYHCSFCIIPFARGRAKSLDFGGILRGAEGLAAAGFREIVLTGVNIGTYFSTESGRPRRFVDLVGRLQEIEGLARLRISSIEPNTVTEPLLKLMSRSEVVCPHLHVPIQSASDRILSAMRRKYRKARLDRLTARIRELLPEAGMGTDVITGFPGETDGDFDETLRFLEKAGFSYVHAFPFSARDGTAAAKLADAIPPETVRRRVGLLRELSEKLRSEFGRKFLGRELPVLFEEPEGERQTGLTPNYLRVAARSRESLHGKIRGVLLEGFHDSQTLSGQIA